MLNADMPGAGVDGRRCHAPLCPRALRLSRQSCRKHTPLAAGASGGCDGGI